MPARYGSEKSKIRYGKYICKVAPMIFRGFMWRLKMKYMVLDFHPLVLFYFASMLLIPLGFLFGSWIVLQKMILHGDVSENYPLLDTFVSLVGVQFLFFAMFFDMQVNNKAYGRTGWNLGMVKKLLQVFTSRMALYIPFPLIIIKTVSAPEGLEIILLSFLSCLYHLSHYFLHHF